MKHRTAKLAIILFLLASGVFVHASLTSSAKAGSSAEPDPQRRAQHQRRRRPARPPATRRPRTDYSNFSHSTAAHKQSCDSCHTNPTPNWSRVRAGDAAFPDVTDFPEHQSCMNCHKQQFFVGARPVICSVCHTNVSPRDGTRHPFRDTPGNSDAIPGASPGAKPVAGAAKKPRADSEFSINFPHDRHQDVMARLLPSPARGGEVGFVRAAFVAQDKAKDVDSCSICHQTYQPQGDPEKNPVAYVVPAPENLPTNELREKAFWMKKGTFKTTPNSHASCFNCHWQDGGEKPLSSDCAGCHKLLSPGTVAAALRPARGDADLAHPSAKGITDREILANWARRQSATFRHEDGNHLDVGCTSCHVKITTVSQLDANTLDVPVQTCSSSKCHGDIKKGIIAREVALRRKPEGASYQCIKCHLGYADDPTPKSHQNLFPVAKPK